MSPKKTRNYIFIFISTLLLTFFACVGVNKRHESPTVHIADIAVKELKPLEAIFNVQLRVLNPNDTAIIAKGINFDIEINNNHLATGVSNAAIEIPAFGTAILPIEVFSSALDVVRNVIALSDKKTLKYRIKGRLRLEGGSFMLSYIPFELEEELDINSLIVRP